MRWQPGRQWQSGRGSSFPTSWQRWGFLSLSETGRPHAVNTDPASENSQSITGRSPLPPKSPSIWVNLMKPRRCWGGILWEIKFCSSATPPPRPMRWQEGARNEWIPPSLRTAHWSHMFCPVRVSAVGEILRLCERWTSAGGCFVLSPTPTPPSPPSLLSKVLLIERSSSATSCFLTSQGTVQINLHRAGLWILMRASG